MKTITAVRFLGPTKIPGQPLEMTQWTPETGCQARMAEHGVELVRGRESVLVPFHAIRWVLSEEKRGNKA